MQLMDHEALSREINVARSTRAVRRQRHLPSVVGSLIAILALVIVFISTLSLENHLPSLRIAEPPPAGAVQRVLEPGTYRSDDSAILLGGTWYKQTIGSISASTTSSSMVTSTAGSTLTLIFYGTDLTMNARVGPEAGKIRVSIDGGTSAVLPSGEHGSFVDLSGNQAEEQQILLATGLAHHDHVLALQSSSDAIIAISGFSVTASTPFPWAFSILYSGIAMLLFVVVRSAFVAVGQDRGWLR